MCLVCSSTVVQNYDDADDDDILSNPISALNVRESPKFSHPAIIIATVRSLCQIAVTSSPIMSGPQFIRPQSTGLSGLGEMLESYY